MPPFFGLSTCPQTKCVCVFKLSRHLTFIFIQSIPQELGGDQRTLKENGVSLLEAPFGEETFALNMNNKPLVLCTTNLCRHSSLGLFKPTNATISRLVRCENFPFIELLIRVFQLISTKAQKPFIKHSVCFSVFTLTLSQL